MSQESCTCKGTGYKGVYHPRTLQLEVIPCDCKK